MNRRELRIRTITITINGRRISKVIVDSHIDKHKDITDDVILDLVRELDGAEQRPDDLKTPFEYFVTLITAFREKKRRKL